MAQVAVLGARTSVEFYRDLLEHCSIKVEVKPWVQKIEVNIERIRKLTTDLCNLIISILLYLHCTGCRGARSTLASPQHHCPCSFKLSLHPLKPPNRLINSEVVGRFHVFTFICPFKFRFLSQVSNSGERKKLRHCKFPSRMPNRGKENIQKFDFQ